MTDARVVVARGLRREYGSGSARHVALDGIELELVQGELVLLFGRSGAGKSTLLHLIGGLDTGFEGRLEVLGHDLARLSQRRLAALRAASLGLVFQEFHLVPHLSALENVLTPNLFHPHPLARHAELARGREVLAEVGLAERADARPAELSGGQRQRVAIARALFHRPELLLCDEPTGNLDAATSASLVELLGALQSALGITVVVATHEDHFAALPHRRVVLHDGRLREDET